MRSKSSKLTTDGYYLDIHKKLAVYAMIGLDILYVHHDIILVSENQERVAAQIVRNISEQEFLYLSKI